MKPDLKIGDKVILRSGGPSMTVARIDSADGTASCVWFQDSPTAYAALPQVFVFPFDTLKVLDG